MTTHAVLKLTLRLSKNTFLIIWADLKIFKETYLWLSEGYQQIIYILKQLKPLVHFSCICKKKTKKQKKTKRREERKSSHRISEAAHSCSCPTFSKNQCLHVHIKDPSKQTIRTWTWCLPLTAIIQCNNVIMAMFLGYL